MSKETLKTLRILVPGVILLLFFLPLYKGSLDPSKIVSSLGEIKDLLYLVVIVPLGALYYILDLRGPFLRPSLQKIHQNLHHKLLSPFADDPAISVSEAHLRTDRRLLDIFYFFIDNDESLKERSKNIYLNGLVWSSVADLMATTSLAMTVYAISFIATSNPHYLKSVGLSGFLFVASTFILQPLVTKKHIRLQNEQLGYILLHKKEELRQKLRAAAGAL